MASAGPEDIGSCFFRALVLIDAAFDIPELDLAYRNQFSSLSELFPRYWTAWFALATGDLPVLNIKA
jgi:hypothetical protein